MTNLEYYWDDISQLRMNNVGVKNGKPCECNHLVCLDCDLYETTSFCYDTFLKWLLAEHKNKEDKDENR